MMLVVFFSFDHVGFTLAKWLAAIAAMNITI